MRLAHGDISKHASRPPHTDELAETRRDLLLAVSRVCYALVAPNHAAAIESYQKPKTLRSNRLALPRSEVAEHKSG